MKEVKSGTPKWLLIATGLVGLVAAMFMAAAKYYEIHKARAEAAKAQAELLHGGETKVSKESDQPKDGRLRFKNWEYKIILADVSWHEARATALQMSGDLASLDSDEKVTFLRPHIGLAELWVGGNKARDRQWRWVNGSLINPNSWQPGRPQGNGDFTVIWGSGLIGDGKERLPGCKGYIAEWSRK